MAPEEKLYQQLHALSMNMWLGLEPVRHQVVPRHRPEGFRASKHNPLRVVKKLEPGAVCREMFQDAAFRARADRVYREFHSYVSPNAPHLAQTEAAPLRVRPVAYCRRSSASTNHWPILQRRFLGVGRRPCQDGV